MTDAIKPRHFRPVPDAQVVPTEQFARVRRLVRDLLDEMGLAVIHGPASSGKTFATEVALALEASLDVVWLVFPTRRTTPQQMLRAILAKATNAQYEYRLYELIDVAREELATRPRLVVIDESHLLPWGCIDLLRHLWDDEATRFALLLVGGDGCWELLSQDPMLVSRFTGEHAARPMTADELLRYLPRFHALYGSADETVVRWVDSNFAHGGYREWTKFTARAVAALGDDGTQLTTALAAQLVSRLPRAPSDAPAVSAGRRRRRGAQHVP